MVNIRLRSFFVISVVMISFMFVITGCQKKEEPKPETPATNVESPAKANTDTVKKEEPKEVDLKGTYSGVFDGKGATLVVTEQDGKSFKGNFTAAYRNPLRQTLEGEFDSKTLEFTMKAATGQFAGTYKGKFNEDFSTMSGTFTLNTGRSNSFTLKKK